MKITPDKILFFDLDGTLVDTDYANWISYREVIRNTLSEEDFKKLNFLFEENFNCRITASTIYNYLAEEKANEIISKKQRLYSAHPFYTKKIEENISILKRFSQTNKIILVSNAKKSRGLETLKYNRLDSYFHQMFFKEDQTLSLNKYENAIKILGINPKNIVAFEDNEEEIQKAKNAGIQYINPKIDGKNIKEILDGVFEESTNSTLIFQDNDKVEIKDKGILGNGKNYKILKYGL